MKIQRTIYVSVKQDTLPPPGIWASLFYEEPTVFLIKPSDVMAPYVVDTSVVLISFGCVGYVETRRYEK